jgi:hypothetical protein
MKEVGITIGVNDLASATLDRVEKKLKSLGSTGAQAGKKTKDEWKGIEEALAKGGEGVGQLAKTFTTSFGAVGAAAMLVKGVVGQVTEAWKEANKEAAEAPAKLMAAQNAMRDLVTKARDERAGGGASRLESIANPIMALTALGGEDALTAARQWAARNQVDETKAMAATTHLMRSGASGGRLDRGLEAAQLVSRTQGMDLEAASQLVGKAMPGSDWQRSEDLAAAALNPAAMATWNKGKDGIGSLNNQYRADLAKVQAEREAIEKSMPAGTSAEVQAKRRKRAELDQRAAMLQQEIGRSGANAATLRPAYAPGTSPAELVQSSTAVPGGSRSADAVERMRAAKAQEASLLNAEAIVLGAQGAEAGTRSTRDRVMAPAAAAYATRYQELQRQIDQAKAAADGYFGKATNWGANNFVPGIGTGQEAMEARKKYRQLTDEASRLTAAAEREGVFTADQGNLQAIMEFFRNNTLKVETVNTPEPTSKP